MQGTVSPITAEVSVQPAPARQHDRPTRRVPHRPTAAWRPLLATALAGLVALSLAAPAVAREPAPDDLPQDPPVDITEQVVDLTFPVADPDDGVHFTDTFLALRGGGVRLHAATDIMAPKHRAVHAAVGGTVSFAPYPEPSYGWMLRIEGDDGRRYSYVHLNNDTPEKDGSGGWLDDDAGGVEHAYAPRIAEAIEAKGDGLNARDGVRVERGELIGWLGDSGNAKGVASHLHLEILEYDDEENYRINPFHSLEAALERGDVADEVVPLDGTGDAEVDDGRLFSDVDPDSTHGPSIERLAEEGIVEGCGDGAYCPQEAIGRGDLAGALTRALGLSAEEPPRFDDVDADDPNAEAIAAVDEHGILHGYTDGRFGPDRALTRAQLATVLVQAFDVSVTASVDDFRFEDVHVDDVHADNIYATRTAGLTTGCKDGSVYCGADDVTRAQIASFIDRQLN